MARARPVLHGPSRRPEGPQTPAPAPPAIEATVGAHAPIGGRVIEDSSGVTKLQNLAPKTLKSLARLSTLRAAPAPTESTLDLTVGADEIWSARKWARPPEAFRLRLLYKARAVRPDSGIP